MKKHAGEEDKLFGSVTSHEIVERWWRLGIRWTRERSLSRSI